MFEPDKIATAVITGHHEYDVVGLQTLFRSIPASFLAVDYPAAPAGRQERRTARSGPGTAAKALCVPVDQAGEIED